MSYALLTFRQTSQNYWTVCGLPRRYDVQVVYDVWRQEYLVRSRSGSGRFERVRAWADVPAAVGRVIA